MSARPVAWVIRTSGQLDEILLAESLLADPPLAETPAGTGLELP
jgi:hypothetical protein